MCFDVQSSLLAWSLTYSISVYLYFRNKGYDRWNAGFIMSFSTIQLLEAGIWTTLGNDKKPELNDILTRLVLLTLTIQPLVQSYMGYQYTKADILALMTWIFIGILIWSLYRLCTSKSGQFSTIAGPNGHLVWSDAKSSNFLGGTWIVIAYLMGLFVPLFFMRERRGAPLIVIGIITAIFSLMVVSKNELSSYWCYTTVLYAISALFL